MHREPEKTTRRAFLAKSAAAATGLSFGLQSLGAPVVRPVLGADEKIRMGFIGVGNRGTQLLNLFMQNSDVEVAALCDVYDPYLTRDPSHVEQRVHIGSGGRVIKLGEDFGPNVSRYKDFRRLLERDDIDAVCVATPDHWHAIQTIMAVEAGKDVYVEKPLSNTIHEGRRMVEAAKRTNRVVQVGLNRRGSSIYRELAPMVQGGAIGKVTLARAFRISNMYPDGIGSFKPTDPPASLDWEMWLGPRAYRPYQDNIAPYKFRWWSEYSSQMGNWGVHYLDAIRWLLGEQAPAAVSAHGGNYALTDDRTIPDTMEVTFEFASGAIAVFGIYEASGGPVIEGGEVELRGTKANLYASASGYTITPSRSGQFQNWELLIQNKKGEFPNGDILIAPKEKKIVGREDSTAHLIRNFLDCVKSREEPLCPLEEGHRSTTFALLANIALEVGARIEWDPKKERITNHEKANDLLHYEYRKPWTLA